MQGDETVGFMRNLQKTTGVRGSGCIVVKNDGWVRVKKNKGGKQPGLLTVSNEPTETGKKP